MLKRLNADFPYLIILVTVLVLNQFHLLENALLLAVIHALLLLACVLLLIKKKKNGQEIRLQAYVYIGYVYLIIPSLLNEWLRKNVVPVYISLAVLACLFLVIESTWYRKKQSQKV